MADLFLPKYRGMIADGDSLVRRMNAEVKASEPCTKKLFPTQHENLHRSRVEFSANMSRIWTQARASLNAGAATITAEEGQRLVTDISDTIYTLLGRVDAERVLCTKRYLKQNTASPGSWFAGDDDEVGDDEPLEIQTGIWHGNAIAYSPATGHMAIEPLRAQAAKLARAGRLPEGISGDLVDALESLHVGDDLILEAGDDVIGDDVIEIGRGKVAKKIAKVSKKTVTKVAKAGKAVAKSKLGKVIKTAVTMSNPVAAVSMKALSKGVSVVKKAKAKPKPKTGSKVVQPAAKSTAKSKAKAQTTLKLATLTQKGKTTPKKAAKVAKKKGIPKSDVKQTAQALSVVDAAEAGNPTAQSVLTTHNQVENAREVPLDPASFATEEESQSYSPSDYEAPETEEMPESEAEESYFGDTPEAEETPDEGEAIDEDEGGDEGGDEGEEYEE